MNTTRFCALAHITHSTLRNWTATFAPFLSPQATPAKGKTRSLTDHDLRVLYLVSMLRDTGLGIADISLRLKDLQRDDWVGLPDLPAEWADPGESVSLGVAVSKAHDVAQIAVLQRDLEYTRAELQTALERADWLDQELTTLKADKAADVARLHALELELGQARGEVDTLRAELRAFTLAYGMGRDHPLPLAVVVGVTALVAVAVVLISLVVLRLVL
jgi:DNA-binding transcriptional MerR regulator